MREILFRGIPKDDIDRHFFTDTWKENCEGSFVYGSLVVAHDRYYICVSALCTINSCVNNGMTSMIEVIPETVGQYTGLCDKNGNMIFEGDIVNFSDILYYIIFVDGCFRICRNHQFSYTLHNLHSSFEIVGNIHDNPKLLEEGATE